MSHFPTLARPGSRLSPDWSEVYRDQIVGPLLRLIPCPHAGYGDFAIERLKSMLSLIDLMFVEGIMTQPSSDPTIAMRGGGYYSDNSINAKKVIDATMPLVEEALRGTVSRTSEKPFAVADFGAADGGTSLELMRKIVRTLRTACPYRAITLTYTDLPYNDFSSLFRRLHGVLDEADAAPLAQEPGVFTFASATSFHRQIFPDATLSFGFSASAMHWLSGKPGLIADHVHAIGATETERASYREQAVSDWTAILLALGRANWCRVAGLCGRVVWLFFSQWIMAVRAWRRRIVAASYALE